jgi:uncharacterized cupredoxin-like copper-binding protein
MRWRLLVPVVASVVGIATATSSLGPGGAAPGEEVLGPGEVTVTIGIEHSRFSVDRLQVRPGTTVRFVVHNTDPIAHELIVGDEEVHRRHASGTEPAHPPVPGELSVGPNQSRSVTATFEPPGKVVFACHLPGHLAYGMHGEIVVTEG